MCLSLRFTLFLENELSFALKLYFSKVNFYRNCNPLAELFWHKLFYYCSNLSAECSRVVVRFPAAEPCVSCAFNSDLFYTCHSNSTGTQVESDQDPKLWKAFDLCRLDCCRKVSSKHRKSRLKALQTWITSEWSSPSVRTVADLTYCELK